MYKIEKNVSMYRDKKIIKQRTQENLFPLNAMDVGDSFLLPAEERQLCASAIQRNKKKSPNIFTVMALRDGNYRVFRTE